MTDRNTLINRWPEADEIHDILEWVDNNIDKGRLWAGGQLFITNYVMTEIDPTTDPDVVAAAYFWASKAHTHDLTKQIIQMIKKDGQKLYPNLYGKVISGLPKRFIIDYHVRMTEQGELDIPNTDIALNVASRGTKGSGLGAAFLISGHNHPLVQYRWDVSNDRHKQVEINKCYKIFHDPSLTSVEKEHKIREIIKAPLREEYRKEKPLKIRIYDDEADVINMTTAQMTKRQK